MTTANERTVGIEVAGEILHVTYRRRTQAQWVEFDEDTEDLDPITKLTYLLERWDFQDEDGNVLPVTVDLCKSLPLGTLPAIITAVYKDAHDDLLSMYAWQPVVSA